MPLLTAGAQRNSVFSAPLRCFFGRPNKPRVEETLNNEVFLGSRRRLHNTTDESVFICSLVHTLVAALLLREIRGHFSRGSVSLWPMTPFSVRGLNPELQTRA